VNVFVCRKTGITALHSVSSNAGTSNHESRSAAGAAQNRSDNTLIACVQIR
jgi:hypothetical protein